MQRREYIAIAVAVSLALHVAILGSAWFWMRQHKAAVALLHPVNPPTVQLVMSPPGGKPHPAATRPAPKPTPDERANKAAPKPTQAPAPVATKAPAPAPVKTAAKPNSAPATPPLPPAKLASADTLPPPADHPADKPQQAEVRADATTAARTDVKPDTSPVAQADATTAAKADTRTDAKADTTTTTKADPQAPAETATSQPAPPVPAGPDDQLSIDLPQAESDTNAWVTGNSVLPPSADVKFHNRKPSYPMEAALRGEQGTVVLLIHVGADGLVTGVDVLRSSGYPTLDRAARDAVVTWHFLPSVRDGQPIPADMPARFIFALD